jgi:hypothetical protein
MKITTVGIDLAKNVFQVHGGALATLCGDPPSRGRRLQRRGVDQYLDHPRSGFRGIHCGGASDMTAAWARSVNPIKGQ